MFMKRSIHFPLVLVLILMFTAVTDKLFSQTSGTLSFSVTTTATSANYGTNNLLAIWIEDNLSAFVKTKIKYASSGNYDHLATWTTASGQNVVDAITGPTRTAHRQVTFLWNATRVNGSVVTDGTYNVWLELAYDKLTAPNEGKAVNSYSFTKGPVATHLTPADLTNFQLVVLDWQPLATGIEGTLESKDFNVYPNPSSGFLKIDFKNPAKECLVKVMNEAGQIEYNEKISDIPAGIRTFDLTRLSSGIYYCTLHFPEKDIVFTIILVK